MHQASASQFVLPIWVTSVVEKSLFQSQSAKQGRKALKQDRALTLISLVVLKKPTTQVKA